MHTASKSERNDTALLVRVLNLPVQVLEASGLAEADELVVDEAILHVVELINVIHNFLTLFLYKVLDKSISANGNPTANVAVVDKGLWGEQRTKVCEGRISSEQALCASAAEMNLGLIEVLLDLLARTTIFFFFPSRMGDAIADKVTPEAAGQWERRGGARTPQRSGHGPHVWPRPGPGRRVAAWSARVGTERRGRVTREIDYEGKAQGHGERKARGEDGPATASGAGCRGRRKEGLCTAGVPVWTGEGAKDASGRARPWCPRVLGLC